MKKLNRKGFTIVELVIVIAVIAILAAVLIPTFTSVIKKANMSKDTQLVRNLNTALATDRTAGKAHNTMQEALDAAAEDGYDIRKINASATGNEILWDSENDMFCYYDAAKNTVSYVPEYTPATAAKRANLWVIRDEVHAEFATYYTGKATSVTTGQSFDAGVGANLKAIEYVNTGAEKSVIIRTVREDTTLTINAPKDTVNHYGPGAIVDIKAVATASYHEFGSFQKAKIAAGRIVVEEAGNIPAVEITANPTAEKPIKIETAKDVVISASNEVTQALGDNKLTNLTVDVKNINAQVVVDAAVKTESVKINGQVAAENNLVAITKVGTLEYLQEKVQDASVKYILLTNDIAVDSLINITTSTTLDGNGYTLTGAIRDIVRINNNFTPAAKTDVVIKNIRIVNTSTAVLKKSASAITTRGNLNSLTLDNVDLIVEKSPDFRQPLTIGGNQAEKATVTITNSTLSSGESSGYAIIMFNPVDLTVTNTQITSWSAFYFKGEVDSAGSAGSTAVATNCEFNTVNNYTGKTNDFGSVVFEDNNITFTAENCVFDVTTKQERQDVIRFSQKNYDPNNGDKKEPMVENVSVTLKKISINGTIANEDVAFTANNLVRIYDGTSVKDPANYLAEGSQSVKQGGLYVITYLDEE